jgi:hypothetical protein
MLTLFTRFQHPRIQNYFVLKEIVNGFLLHG